eukprot:1327-Heterococcus_DN1.PRE.2
MSEQKTFAASLLPSLRADAALVLNAFLQAQNSNCADRTCSCRAKLARAMHSSVHVLAATACYFALDVTADTLHFPTDGVHLLLAMS